MSDSPTLWELGDALNELESVVFEILDADDLTESEKETKSSSAFEKWLTAGTNFDEKAAKVAEYIKHQEALAEARRTEYRRLRALADRAQNKADALRRYLVNELQRTGRTRIESVRVDLSLRRKPAKVLLNCPVEELPPDCVKVTIEPRLTEIRKLIQENPDIDWAFLSSTVEFSLTIK